MKYAALAVLALAALGSCGGDMEPGAYLQVDTIPAGTTELEVVLASAPNVVPMQHTGTGFAAAADVPYYVQRGSTGGFAPVAGKTSLIVHVKPALDPEAATDVVPIVIARSAAGEDSTILAMGMLPVGSGSASGADPAVVPMMDLTAASTAVVYELALEPVHVGSGLYPGTGELIATTCPVTATSSVAYDGIAWTNAASAQLRLLRLAHSAGDGSDLPLDVDCDTYTADGGDCDDLVGSVHEDAAEECDDIDSNCDGARFWATACGSDAAPMECQVGRAVCDEEAAAETCHAAPAPSCGTGDWVCRFSHSGMAATPICAPAASNLTLPPTVCAVPPCTVDVVPNDGAWLGQVGLVHNGQLPDFGDSVVSDNQGTFMLEVIPRAPVAMPVLPTNDVGVIDLLVSEGSGAGTYFAVGLVVSTDNTDGCKPASSQGPGSGSGPDAMLCNPIQ